MEMELKRSDTRYLMAFYIFPIVCKEKKDFNLILHSRFIGVYIGDTNKPAWGNKIFVVFKNLAPKNFKTFYNNNEYAYSNYYEEIDGDCYDIYSFHIPNKFKTDTELVLNNEFTKVSSIFISKIDWISYPKDSTDLFKGYDKLHKKLRRIDPNEVQLDLNKVNKRVSITTHPFLYVIRTWQPI